MVKYVKGRQREVRKAIYWASTALLCLLYRASALMDVTEEDMVRQALGAMGYPAYLVPNLIPAMPLVVVVTL